MSNTVCCVVGCSLSYKNRPQGVAFYQFPRKSYSKEVLKKWIAAVNRVNSDGTPWYPTAHTMICSQHFVGGKKSNVQTHPAYIPSIFPKIRHRFAQKTKKVKTLQQLPKSRDPFEIILLTCVGTQINMPSNKEVSGDAEEIFEFVCVRDPSCCVGVQCSIPENFSIFPYCESVDFLERSNKDRTEIG